MVKPNFKKGVKFSPDGAKDYGQVAAKIFAPIYPVIAGQIKKRCGIKQGVCLDIGSGPGHLGMAMTRGTRLKVYAVDFAWEILKIAKKNIKARGLEQKIKPVLADVHRIPFQKNSAALVVSRGSMRFWKNKVLAFKEIVRVLEPGGKAYVGGGAGNAKLDAQIGKAMMKHHRAAMVKRGRQKDSRPKRKYGKMHEKVFKNILRKAGAVRCDIINDDSGFWIYLEKRRRVGEKGSRGRGSKGLRVKPM
ncbi:MAG: class I SAM-dependent methyltransferase [Desulfobacteraceae bacterium]|nr:MAG: class I SAM-dependent methyltransferase [Desulfobacteraceae bacterium]